MSSTFQYHWLDTHTPLMSDSRAMQGVLHQLQQEANHQAPLVVLGESGTGKTIVAHHLHARSAQETGRFVTLDIASLIPETVEQLLLGYWHKSIFGRAELVPGVLASAAGGTLWLRGLEKMSWDFQRLLVPILVDRQYHPIGVQEAMPVQCRVVLGMSLPTWPRSSERLLVPELWDALKDRVVVIPTLQQRKDDLPHLASHYLAKLAKEWQQPLRHLSADANKLLKRYRWPGNVSELYWVLAYAATATQGNELLPHHFPPHLATGVEAPDVSTIALEDFVEQKLSQFFERVGQYEVSELYEAIETQMERPLLKLAMRHTKDNQIKAAKLLGINRNTLRSKLRKYAIK